jgi:hypothetical protein
LEHVYGLYKESALFSEEEKMEFKHLFSHDEKLNQNTYFADVFGLLNQINNYLQGRSSYTIGLYDKIRCFK